MESPEAAAAEVFADLFNFSDDHFLETPRLSDDLHQEQLSTPQPPPTMATKIGGGEEERPMRHEEYDEEDEDFLGSFPEVTVDELRWVLNREGESALDNFDALLSTPPEPKRPSPVSVLESAPRWWPAPQKKRTKGRQKKKAAFPLFKVPTKERRDVPLPGAERRRCWHCAAEETPQWRAGPEGPKTLCNACGVRFKSGRLLPEYRPANSPTFSSELHSNSHRKVLEMRRWKEKETGWGPLPPGAAALAPAAAALAPAAAGMMRRRKKKKKKGGILGGNPRVGTGVPLRNFY